MSEVTAHLQELAGRIGPRPATTDAEVEAADYIHRVLETRRMEVFRQEFVAPRTYSWAFVLYHVLTIGAAVLANWLAWPAFAIALVVAVVMWLDLDTRWGLSSLMPKGPSQNVIGRSVPPPRRGEKARKVVVVAHYDSAYSSLAFGPALVKNFAATFGLMKWCTWLVAPLVLVMALPVPFVDDLMPWYWYGVLAVSGYLLVPALINVHRELFKRPVDGANDNASGVAAMLRVAEVAVPEESVSEDTLSMQAVEPVPEVGGAWTEDLAPAEVEVAPPEVPSEQPEAAAPVEEGPLAEGPLAYAPAETPEPRPSYGEDETELAWDEPGEPIDGQERLGLGVVEEPDGPGAPGKPRWGFRRKRTGEGVGEWLGVEEGFDARDEGRRLGSFGRIDETDDVGEKGGTAGRPNVDAPSFAHDEASRIRHRVTHGVDRALAEKEIWFVATGCEESGTWGMRAFLDEYGDEVSGAAIVNLDNVGTGSVSWVTREGMVRRYSSDRRLMSAAKRVVREEGLRVKGREYRGLSTDAVPALARGFRAMSVMAFDINGRLPNWHWRTDTLENVSVENVELAAEFAAAVIRTV